MAGVSKAFTWLDIWRAISEKKSVARRRALRETSVILATSLIPLLLGGFLSYAWNLHEAPHARLSLTAFLTSASLSGQLYLVFLSLAGANFSRLWDTDGPRVEYAVAVNLFTLVGAMLTAGLIAIDDKMSTFGYSPLNWLSVLFFAVALLHYFCLAIPSHMEIRNPQVETERVGRKMADDLSERMS